MTTPTTQPLAYDDSDTLAGMRADCHVVNARLAEAARRAVATAPSIHFDEQPRESPKREVEISAATAALATAIYEG